MKRIYVLLGFLMILSTTAMAQSETNPIFRDTKVINTFSTTTLPKRILDVRIVHRFGDIAGNSGGWQTLYGLENASDISIGADYGVTDNLMVGLNRSKGAGPLTQLINLQGKYRFLKTESDRPLALAVAAVASLSTREKVEDPTSINYFPEFNHRLIYFASFIAEKKVTNALALHTNLSYVHRNYVQLGDENSLFLVGLAGKLQATKTFALLFDWSYPISVIRTEGDSGYHNPWGVAAEWTTGGGHVFQVNLVNARGIAPTDYLPNSYSDWTDGEYRLGFRISRLFRI